jgi:hypothetical protein
MKSQGWFINSNRNAALWRLTTEKSSQNVSQSPTEFRPEAVFFNTASYDYHQRREKIWAPNGMRHYTPVLKEIVHFFVV